MYSLIDLSDEPNHIVRRHLVKDQEVSMIEFPGAQVELVRAVCEADHMCCVGVFRRLELVLEYLHCRAIKPLLELIGAFEEDRPLLYLIHLTLESNFIVEVWIHWVVAQVNYCRRPQLRRTILQERLDQVLLQFVDLLLINHVENLHGRELLIHGVRFQRLLKNPDH